jgi:hypothetical protein
MVNMSTILTIAKKTQSAIKQTSLFLFCGLVCTLIGVNACQTNRNAKYALQENVYIMYDSYNKQMQLHKGYSGKEKYESYHFTYTKPYEGTIDTTIFRFSYYYLPKSLVDEGLGYDLERLEISVKFVESIQIIDGKWFESHTGKQISSYFGKYTSRSPALYLIRKINDGKKVELLQIVYHAPTYE